MPRYRTKIKPKAQPKQNLLPLWLTLLGIGLVLVAFFVFWNNSRQQKANIQVTGAPRLQVDQEVIDYGDVKLGTPVKTDVRVTNIGDQPLRFTEAPFIEIKEGC